MNLNLFILSKRLDFMSLVYGVFLNGHSRSNN